MGKGIEDIVIDRLKGKPLDAEEERAFARWYEQAGNRKRYYEWQKMRDAVYANAKAKDVTTDKVWQTIYRPKQASLYLRHFMKYAALAFIFLSMGIAFYWLRTPQETPLLTEQVTVEPGKKQAVLTLSTGEQIQLTDSTYQTLTEKNGIVIRNNAPNMLEYDKAEETKEIAYNTIYIPRGGEYKLILSDGTIVWLNSESRLRYPIAFSGARRELTLEGEAFFEVAKDQSKPFIVHTDRFDVRVTGTQFNVRTYPDEPESATLTEGQIQLERGEKVHHLIPGQQAVLAHNQITIRKVNPEEAVAWRYEAFCFKQCRLESIMNELSRWYDVEVFYLNPELKELHFTAWFRRSSSFDEVISILEKTQRVKMEVKGKTVMIR